MRRGGQREGAGRKPLDSPPAVRGIRCTDAGWQWLNGQAAAKGHTSVGKWADSLGRKAKRKANVLLCHSQGESGVASDKTPTP